MENEASFGNYFCRWLLTFYESILGGICISIGCIINLTMKNNPIAGAVFFSVGLLAILTLDFYLFTGKAGYVFVDPIQPLITIWFGNLVGTKISAMVVMKTKLYFPELLMRANIICNDKSADSFTSLFCLAMFCGALMYIAVEGFNVTHSAASVILPVAVFVLCGFEHSVADMFYYNLCDWNLVMNKQIIVVTLGNLVGAVIMSLPLLAYKHLTD